MKVPATARWSAATFPTWSLSAKAGAWPSSPMHAGGGRPPARMPSTPTARLTSIIPHIRAAITSSWTRASRCSTRRTASSSSSACSTTRPAMRSGPARWAGRYPRASASGCRTGPRPGPSVPAATGTVYPSTTGENPTRSPGPGSLPCWISRTRFRSPPEMSISSRRSGIPPP